MKREDDLTSETDRATDNVVPITPEVVENEPLKIPCGMCLTAQPTDVLVPVCIKCASKLESHIKHVLSSMNEIVKLLYPKQGNG